MKLTEIGPRKDDNVASKVAGGRWVRDGDGMNWQTFDFGRQLP